MPQVGGHTGNVDGQDIRYIWVILETTILIKFQSLGVGARASVFLSSLGDSNEQLRLRSAVWEGGKYHILENH